MFLIRKVTNRNMKYREKEKEGFTTNGFIIYIFFKASVDIV